MLRIPVQRGTIHQKVWTRSKSSSSIRNTFIEYFVEKHAHKRVKSSSVVPLCDPSVPFVNAGMNQFKGVFLGKVAPPCIRAVNSQKCVRVGGKHNDLEVVGTDGHHHTFFEMLGNWSFGDYYKKEACQMAWDLLLGPYRLKPEDLVVTYFSGDAIIGLPEDRECRDIWKSIGVAPSRLKGLGAADNFWEMGTTGPCGPCTEIHYVNPDGSLTEIWNLVFIQCNRETDGSVKQLSRHHVDTGMGLERMATILQQVPSNYDTDLFQPIIKAIEKNSKDVSPYTGSYKSDALLDCAYRRLADHARMISVCLADGVFPASSLNLKQIMRKSFKISTDIFKNSNLLPLLYDEVVQTLGSTYPELVSKAPNAKVIMEHEGQAYAKMRAGLVKKWKELVVVYPEVEAMGDVEMAGFPLGYREFKETMSKHNSTIVPGELVFKLYDTHGFQEDIIQRIADLNNLSIDKEGFWKLLSKHKQRHKTSFKEQNSNKGLLFDESIDNFLKNGYKSTDDSHKYNYEVIGNRLEFPPLRTKLIAILNEQCEWIDYLDACEHKPYYLVTEKSNFYCEEGGQAADSGTVQINDSLSMKVESVFKIRDFIFHKGHIVIENSEKTYLKCGDNVTCVIDSEKRFNTMLNHTGIHLLNAAIRQVLPNSVVCQTGSSVTDKGFSLNLSVYGEKLSQKVVLDAQELVRESIRTNAPVETRVIDSVQLSREDSVVTVPGETYPETGLRLVTVQPPLVSKELCCGTHAPRAGLLQDLCVTLVKGAGGHAPTVHAITNERALQAQELFSRARKLEEIIELVEPERRKEEVANIKRSLTDLCGSSGAPHGEYAQCLAMLDTLHKRPVEMNDTALHAIAETEIREAVHQAEREGRRFAVHFVRCSYLMQAEGVARAIKTSASDAPALPAMLLGCAGGVILAACTVPQEVVSSSFSAAAWLRCVARVFDADVLAAAPGAAPEEPLTYAQMSATKVSLINCEQLVQDAMRVAIKFAQSHVHKSDGESKKNRQQN
ncbi:alanine--tRNA ligase, mitochondrial [Manduca sexta]|uniref:alanine--tRNA ligase, mitochondrial n=1 Tax=Manduca sexta TaxID=7130 RepID=UPI00188F187B|nr:alanine--tRNA ligase, mitochondrial [Manduca sexta]